ncbi:MAG: protein kinase [Terriglobales bacterium]
MPISAGQKIGPYQVISQLGAGGMGEVYRARDSRLARDVAIKVLPASFSSDPDRLQRFAQEARAAAALSHPNIMAIFDIGDNQGSPYVVSELLEGDTLRGRLRTGPLSIRKTIDYALQIARGLAAAHEKGIVHRDLKPENLFVTEDGRVKILDFGLAKLTLPGETRASSDAPTIQVATNAGLVMGTAGYMSPEQVRGQAADTRSDLFAFGAILYEMLTGKRAFHGDTPADTMSAILKEEPPELSETARNVPPALERIVHHCLEKNPAARFQSASDVAFNLGALTDTSSASTSRSGAQTVAAPAKRTWLLPVLAGLLVAASYVAVYFAARHSSSAPLNFHRLTYRRGTIQNARFSPDGQNIVYGGALEGKPTELFTTRFDSTDSRALGLQKTDVLAISTNGELAVLLNAHARSLAETGTLARLPLAGGAPREVMDNVGSVDWTPDGSDLAVAHGDNAALEFPVGRVIYQPQGWISHVRFSPHGDLLAFADHVISGDDGRVVVTDRDGKRKTASSFYTTVEGLAWSKDGKEVWFTASPGGSARAIYALSLSGKERLILRVPAALTLQDVARNGRVLLTEDNMQMGLMDLAPGGTAEKDLSWFDWSLVSDLSPDGKALVFSETGEAVGTDYGIYLRKTDGSPAIRLGSGGGAALSPDGNWVVVLDHSSPTQLVLLPTGAGQPRRLTNDQFEHFGVRWIPDGSGLVFLASGSNQPGRTYWMDLNGKSRPITPQGTIGQAVTADSKYLFASDREHKHWLYPLTGGDPRPFPTVLHEEDRVMRFDPDGKSVLVSQRGIPTTISRVFLDDGRREQIRQIAPVDLAGVEDIYHPVLSADTKSYAYSYYRVLSELWVVEGLK